MAEHKILGGLSPADFLRDYWQKKPLLIREAFPDFVPPVGPDELAGLACEPDVHSRLVLEEGGAYPWELRFGPFPEDELRGLASSHWSLLVQEADRHVPAVADLMDRFDFLPDWRKDDVMISFAPGQGGVGPHIDSYDVFLLQATGRREWQICEPGEHFRYRSGLDVCVLENFECQQKWVLKAGDMLYLPPGYPHNGIALEPSMTYSFGFLAPSRGDMLASWARFQEKREGVRRYQDPDLVPPSHPAEIDEAALQRISSLIDKPVSAELAEWFGGDITRAARQVALELPEEPYDQDGFAAALDECGRWRRNEQVRWAFHRARRCLLFVNGETFEVPAEAAIALTSRREFERQQLASISPQILLDLTNRGYGYFPGESDEF